MFFPFIPAQIIFIHMHHEMHRSGIYRVIKKTLDSLRKHLIHKRKQLHKVVNRKKSDSKYTAYKAQSSALHENKLLY